MPTPPNRRWTQLSLRMMFVNVTVLGALLGWLTWDLQQVRHRKTTGERLSEQAAIFAYPDDNGPLDEANCVLLRKGNLKYKLGPIRKLMGDQETRSIYYMDRNPTDDELEALRAFPEATVYGFKYH